MSQRPPRPRAFRLDDVRVAVDDAPAPPTPAAIIQSQHEPIPPMTGAPPLDEAELEVEAAQKSGLLSRWRFSLGGLLWTGVAGLASLAFGLWTTSLIEGLFAKAEFLGCRRARLRRPVPDRARRTRRRARFTPSRARRGSPRCMSPSPRRAAPTTATRRREAGAPARPRSTATGRRRPRAPRRDRGRRARHHRRARPDRRRRTRAPAGRSTRRRKAKSPPPPSASRWSPRSARAPFST